MVKTKTLRLEDLSVVRLPLKSTTLREGDVLEVGNEQRNPRTEVVCYSNKEAVRTMELVTSQGERIDVREYIRVILDDCIPVLMQTNKLMVHRGVNPYDATRENYDHLTRKVK
jgi:hypothetical protein